MAEAPDLAAPVAEQQMPPEAPAPAPDQEPAKGSGHLDNLEQ